MAGGAVHPTHNMNSCIHRALRRDLELCPERDAPGLRNKLARDLAECEARLAGQR